jgi:hypothetical protein
MIFRLRWNSYLPQKGKPLSPRLVLKGITKGFKPLSPRFVSKEE